ncbi:MAG: hypothetical protein JXN10_10105 [Clostridia bacterium]|nr:hypothetical protein [Clostridia bacterium]MBN2883872.1 hypothetical protein [Clostridia bacterium]
MDYLADRVKKLIEEAEVIEWDTKYRLFIKKMIEVLEDCALVADDLVDAVDEFDMRLSEIEDRLKDGDGPE